MQNVRRLRDRIGPPYASRRMGHPARIIETQCKYELVRSEFLMRLPAIPEYPQPIRRDGFPVAPGGKADFFTMRLRSPDGHPINKGELDTDVIAGIQMGAFHLRVYGYVKYLDGITEDVRESRFCDYSVWPFSRHSPRATGFRPLIGVPPGYTNHT
jgi:hypothetical protein